MVIAHYGIPLRKAGTATLRGKCPLPTHGSERSKDSFTAALDKGVGGAWACQSNSCTAARGGRRGGNALDFVAAMERCSVREAAIKMRDWFGAGSAPAPAAPAASPARAAEQGRELVQPVSEVSEKDSRAGESGPNKPLEFTLRGVDPSHPYLASRGLSRETLDTFGVGFFGGRGSMAGRAVVPIHNAKGELVAYAGRSVDQREPKYRFPAGFRKSEELFNFHRASETDTDTVIVVEGFFDCMRVHESGFPNVVALMGCTCARPQEDLLAERFERVVLMLDGDEPGREAQRLLVVQFAGRCFVRTAAVPDGKQPDQLSADDLVGILRPIVG
jgi:DNA primase